MLEDYDWSDGSSARLGTRPHNRHRHTMYHEDAQQIMDSIHADTEKMIKEIVEKYGNLDDVASLPLPPVPPVVSGGEVKPKLQNKRVEELKYTAQKGDKNEHGFLSEDEMSSDSLEECSLNADSEEGENKKRKVCRKHPQGGGGKTISPRISGSSPTGRMYDRSRNVSLSEILMDDKDIVRRQRCPAEQTTIGGGEPKSEESFLSDDFSNENLSYYNSMESIMSDESAECKSAPLDVVFNKRPAAGIGVEVTQEAALSKSYGSSPNNCPGFDYYYMQNAYSMANQSIPQSNTYPKLSEALADEEEEDDIPSSQARMNQYKAAMNKSLREDFGKQRAARQGESPLWQCEEVPVKFKREDIFGQWSGGGFGPDLVHDCESRATEQSFRKFEQNLQKFERDRSLFGHAMQMDYVPHKPPMAGRRSTSMRSKRRKNLSGKFNTMGNIDQFQEGEEGSLGTGDDQEGGLIGLQLSFNEPEQLNNSTDKLVVVLPKELKQCNWDVSAAAEGIEMPNDIAKFNDIRDKIEIVQKLVEMEERKLEEAKRLKESRMRPFQANVKEKGYVKSLTMNFDNLAKGGAELGSSAVDDDEGDGEYTVPRELRVKRIKSVPELESVKFRSFHVLPDEGGGVGAGFLPNRFYNDLSNSDKNNTNEQQQQQGMSQGSRSRKEIFKRRAKSLS